MLVKFPLFGFVQQPPCHNGLKLGSEKADSFGAGLAGGGNIPREINGRHESYLQISFLCSRTGPRLGRDAADPQRFLVRGHNDLTAVAAHQNATSFGDSIANSRDAAYTGNAKGAAKNGRMGRVATPLRDNSANVFEVLLDHKAGSEFNGHGNPVPSQPLALHRTLGQQMAGVYESVQQAVL